MGTVYDVSFWYDEAAKQKRITWEPTTDAMRIWAAGKQEEAHRHTYSIVSTCTAWKPSRMTPNPDAPGQWEATGRIGFEGQEQFHFLRDGDKNQAIYPAQAMTVKTSIPIRGPDGRNQYKHWIMRGPIGEKLSLKLQVSDGDITLEVVSATKGTKTWTSPSDHRRGCYFVAGTWNNWTCAPMSDDGKGDHYCAYVTVLGPVEEFQIVVDEDFQQALYPEMHGASPGACPALGPDNKGAGVHWAVRAAPGTRILVELDFSREDPRGRVTFKAAGQSSPVDGAGDRD